MGFSGNNFAIEKHPRILESLKRIVGSPFVTDREEERYYYSSDPSGEDSHLAEFIVVPGAIEEITEILKLANLEKIPITPRVGGLTLSGLALPYEGGILLDLKRLDKILEVNTDSMYCIIECGVTIGKLKSFLEKNYSSLWFSMPHAPPSVGVISNAIIYGAGQLSLKHGANSDMIVGLEIAQPTGTILRTGSCALNRSWLTRYCLPDFAGLFLGWFGATGIITKAAIQLWPKPAIQDVLFYKIKEIDNLTSFLLNLTKSELCADICCYSWTGSSGKSHIKLSHKPENLPEITMDILLNGHSQTELEFKKAAVRKVASGLASPDKIEEYERPLNVKEGVLMVPRVYPFMDLAQGGGTEYLGSYLPTETIATAYLKGIEVAHKYGFQYLHFIRPLRAGHLTCLLYIFPFNKKTLNESKNLLNAVIELSEATIELGGVPWKPSPTVQKVILKHLNSEYIQLIKKVKNLFDPNLILAPRQWTL